MKEGKEAQLLRRHRRIRKKVNGTPERPRLVVHRSHLHLYAQIIDDSHGKTVVACSTRQPKARGATPKGGNLEAAKLLGSLLAKRAHDAGIKQVVFDRGGYPYHGRIKALADAARVQGLVF